VARKARPWAETRAELRLHLEVSEDPRLAQALEIIAGLEDLTTAQGLALRTGGPAKTQDALARLERAGYTR